MDNFLYEKYFLGCNYWASHAGTNMWSDWSRETVEEDLKKLKNEAGLDVIRAFPLWSDFQPINLIYGGMGTEREVRIGEAPLGNSKEGLAGIDPVMIERYASFLDICVKYDFKVIVPLITGWMSGRLYVPPAIYGKNVITDPFAIMWEVRFVRYFVEHFKAHPAIVAWELGNECNCCGEVENEYQSWLWTSTIANTVKSIDTSVPFISGMHSLLVDKKWTPKNQGENCDILTTHPYNVFVPYANYEKSNSIKPIMHSTAETRCYADLSEKPTFVEEIGSLGGTSIGDENAGRWARASLFSTWANDCYGFMWWCAFEQSHLTHAPYDWTHLERELGMFYVNGELKPVAKEFAKFKEFLSSLPFEKLPKREADATVILSNGQDTWANAYSTFIFAKEAGFDVDFTDDTKTLKDSPLYIMPSIKSDGFVSKRLWDKLKEKVKNGSDLYVSYDGSFISEFKEVFGIEIQTRYLVDKVYNLSYNGTDLSIFKSVNVDLKNIDAEVLSVCDDNPIFTKHAYGNGNVYFLNAPLEVFYSQTPGTFENTAFPVEIYKTIGKNIINEKPVNKSNVNTGITYHRLSDNEYVICCVNYEDFEVNERFIIKEGWLVDKLLYGEMKKINPNDALVFIIKKQD